VLISTLAARMNGGVEAARETLAARIDNVMAFEKWKAQFHPVKQATELAQALGRIRYGKG
jgi:ubiquinone biosynthesis protein COQ9